MNEQSRNTHELFETRSVGQRVLTNRRKEDNAYRREKKEREGHHSPHTATTTVVDVKNLSIKWSGKNFKWKKSHTHQDDDDDDDEDDQKEDFKKFFFLSSFYIYCCLCPLET